MVLVEEGAIIAGKYRLERALASGGMGSLWIARHLQLDAPVAIKFIALEQASSADAQARFEREAKASAHLRTPNVVQVYDYGVEDGTPYIAMELLEGEDLGARLAREGRLSLAPVLVIVNQLCRALRRAHEVGLVHRDLKPANIFLAHQDGEEVVKVLDFGIAKDTSLRLNGSATKTGTLLGSPYYMSPEQVRGSKDIDRRSDLWSVGVIIFQCLTGKLPFRAEELGELFLEICSEDIPLASQVAPDLGPGMDDFLARALARDPRERFQSAEDLAAAFAAAVGPRDAAAGAVRTELTAAGTPPNLDKHQTGISTLSPTGHSFVAPPRRSHRIEILLALLTSALVLGLITWDTIRARAPAAAPTPALDEAASPPPATAPATAAEAPPPSSDTPPPVAPSAAPSATASASATAPQRRRPPPPPPKVTLPPPPKVTPPPPPPTKPRTSDDPTNHI